MNVTNIHSLIVLILFIEGIPIFPLLSYAEILAVDQPFKSSLFYTCISLSADY